LLPAPRPTHVAMLLLARLRITEEIFGSSLISVPYLRREESSGLVIGARYEEGGALCSHDEP
jgi:hypothetical protein